MSVEGELAKLLLLDQLLGKTLEAKIGVNQPNWHYYWPLLDGSLIAALDKRFERFRGLHPELVPPAA